MVEIVNKIKKLSNGKSLLLVEDDLDLLKSLEQMLSHFFASIYTASNVHDALEIYRQEHVKHNCLVITDINLGTQNGVYLTSQLKEIYADQRVIAISASQESAIFIESIECGIDRFLLKPIEKQKLFETLMAVLEKIEYDQKLELSTKLLENSKEYALRLLHEQDQFLKNAIHEIHTPLAVIITNIDLLRMQGIENESLRAIEAGSRIIQSSYEDMTYLMKHSRNASIHEWIDLLDFIKERIEYFQCIAEANALKIVLFVGQLNLKKIYFPMLKLSRLVDNTLSNAIKYAYKPSEIHITIGMKKEELFFEIRNKGPVIEDKQKIFERFYRESDTKGGYGLGLHIVLQICEEENVGIKLTSSIKQGTAFRYTFKA